MRSTLARALRNRISALGVALTTASAIIFLFLLALELFGYFENPYVGLVVFAMLPTLFAIGLLLIPIGLWLERRRRRAGIVAPEWPTFDLNDASLRRTMFFVLVATLVNVGIVSMASYGAIEYTETREFCGQVCHVPMKPEFVAHQSAAHAAVPCVRCHVAPGAAGLLESKLAGISRVFAVAGNSFPRPIPPPVAELIPARDTCERCHWPEKFHGEVLKRVAEYADDQANTETVTMVRLRVGGGSERSGVATGIHWHMNIANEIEFVPTDERFQTIPYVRLKDRSGTEREYFAPGITAEQIAGAERRRMQCMDCHNRPAHPIAESASRAVDQRIAAGQIPRTLPFVRRESVKVLQADYSSEPAAMDAIANALGEFYRGSYQDVYQKRPQEIERVVQTVQAVYRENVFPDMHVKFGTYINNIGHINSPGCFRCHDDEKATRDGRKISQDCELCHTIE
jgi:hypothetical protein